MVARLIQSKLKTRFEERPLTKERVHTVRFAKSNLGVERTTHLTDALIQLAANHLPLYEIINGLSRGSTATSPYFTALENTLAVALYLDRPFDVKILLGLGAKAQARTKSFGDPFIHAACHGQLSTYLLVLSVSMATADGSMKLLISSRHVLALQQATAYGRAALFGRDLYRSKEHMYAYHPVHLVYESVIKSATLASQVEVVFAVFQMLDEQDTDILDGFCEKFWVETLRLASSNNLESLVRFILGRTSILSRHESLNLPTEDASSSGNLSVLALLIANRSGHNLTSYADAAYWLARGAHYDALSSLFVCAKGARSSLLGDALCGASKHGARGMSAVLRIADECLVEDFDGLSGESFSKVIDNIIYASGQDMSEASAKIMASAEASQSCAGDIIRELMGPEDRELAHACASGDFSVVQRIVAKHADQRPPPHTAFTSCYVDCIEHNHPGTLQYLCERYPPSEQFLNNDKLGVRSTAILQVLLDYGWNVNGSLDGMRPPTLGYVRLVY